MLDLDMKGRTVLITGATGQLGRVMALKFAECNADVIIHYNSNRAKAEDLYRQVTEMGRKAYIAQADITDQASIEQMKADIEANFKLPDILVDNAVIQYEQWLPVLDQDPKDYYSQFESCVMQTVYMTKAFLPHMKEQGWGRVVCTNTECAALAEAGSSAYVSAKRGLDGVVRCLAKEVGAYGITVNQVAPGWTISYVDRENGTEVDERYNATVPLKRRGTDEEIAHMAVFLASDLCSYTTGAYFPVCGGRVMPGI